MKNEILAEAIEIANRTTTKIPTREHLLALFQELVKVKQIIRRYRRKVDSHHVECTGIILTCPCLVCQSVRTDDRQDKMDRDNENFGPELAGDK